jgi:hypothetical protein
MKGFFRILSIPAVKYSILAILVAGVGVLLYWNYGMISENVAAQEHIQQRETAVIEQQKAIKEIVKLYREVNGRYPGSMEEGNAKYYIGDDKSGNRIDIEYFGVTVGSLEKVSLDGSWEDQRSKQ